MTETREKFNKLLRNFDTAVLITQGTDNPFRARPMAIAGLEDNGDLWFITRADSSKVHEIENDTHVQIICQNGWSACVCISGLATVVRDRARIREFWKPAYLVWFPLGADDPGVVLLRVTGIYGEYWDNSGLNRLNYIYQTIKAVVSGTTPVVNDGDIHGKANLGV